MLKNTLNNPTITMTTLEILTEVEAGRMSATEALEMLEMLEPITFGARYQMGAYSGKFLKAEDDKAFFDIDQRHDFIRGTNGYVGFRLEFAKTFKRI